MGVLRTSGHVVSLVRASFVSYQSPPPHPEVLISASPDTKLARGFIPPPLRMPHLRRGPGLQEPLRPLPWYTCVSQSCWYGSWGWILTPWFVPPAHTSSQSHPRSCLSKAAMAITCYRNAVW
jgi:hypothetical protein